MKEKKKTTKKGHKPYKEDYIIIIKFTNSQEGNAYKVVLMRECVKI